MDDAQRLTREHPVTEKNSMAQQQQQQPLFARPRLVPGDLIRRAGDRLGLDYVVRYTDVDPDEPMHVSALNSPRLVDTGGGRWNLSDRWPEQVLGTVLYTINEKDALSCLVMVPCVGIVWVAAHALEKVGGG